MKKKVTTILITALVTTVISVTFTLSFLKTSWTNYEVTLSTWWSIISTLLSVLLGFLSIWQYLEAEGQKKRTKSQIKIWMQDAKGLVNALKKVQSIKHTKTSDACNAISMIEASAVSMYQSLYEERVVKEEDYQESEKKKTDILTEQEIQELKAKASTVEANAVSSYSKTVISNSVRGMSK